jgi:diguanylate cyclase (GGDEF)-like protein
VSSQIIDLDLSCSPERQRAESLLGLCDRLLGLTAEHVPEDATLKTDAFRRQVDQWRQDLREEEDAARMSRLSRRIAVECEDFLDHVRGYRADREAEFLDLVRMMQEMLDAVRGESRQFQDSLARSTTAMEKVVEIEDIRELKRVLAREVQALREVVAQRQAAEGRHYETLVTRVQTLEQSLTRARADAATDALTGIPNRGAFDLALREWLGRAARDGRAFTLAMVDLDDFKRINDTHGHPVGDRVIIAAARLLGSGLVDGEFVARFGGEEFALLLQTTSVGKAKERLVALLARVAPAYEYDHLGEKRFVTFTFSGGVTDWTANDSPDSILKRADEALYDAKRRGKKRVETRSRSFLRTLIG